jgi:hypothetical protein
MTCVLPKMSGMPCSNAKKKDILSIQTTSVFSDLADSWSSRHSKKSKSDKRKAISLLVNSTNHNYQPFSSGQWTVGWVACLKNKNTPVASRIYSTGLGERYNPSHTGEIGFSETCTFIYKSLLDGENELYAKGGYANSLPEDRNTLTKISDAWVRTSILSVFKCLQTILTT